MEKIEDKLTPLNSIITIAFNIMEEGFSSFGRNVSKELDTLASYLECSNTQAYFVGLIFYISNEKDSAVSLSDIAKLIKCKTIELYKYNNILSEIEEKGYIIKKSTSNFNNKFGYAINSNLTESIIQNEALPSLIKPKSDNFITVLDEINKISDRFIPKEGYSWSEKYFNSIVETNKNYKIFKKIKQYNMHIKFEYSFYIIAWNRIFGKKEIDVNVILKAFRLTLSDRVALYQDFIDEDKNPLIKNKLIEINHTEFLTDSLISLTPKALKLLTEAGVTLLINTNKPKEVIEVKNIKKQKLFFDKKEGEQLEMINEILNETKYKKVQKKLESKNLPTGVTVMLHGYPGTGKTESVLQAAKKTGRDLFKVDISNAKSMWFGESEKKIKQIFDDYRSYKSLCKKTPILFFNEADAIISKRRSNSDSNTSQTENAIQNILLEELENFDGIFMATTNLVDNIDSAFERRFLFKVEFNKPSTEIVAKIWKIKISKLSVKQCEKLAELYKFTGGQINNIIRKIDMFEIIKDVKVTFETIQSFCEEERFEKAVHRNIGFRNLTAS